MDCESSEVLESLKDISFTKFEKDILAASLLGGVQRLFGRSSSAGVLVVYDVYCMNFRGVEVWLRVGL